MSAKSLRGYFKEASCRLFDELDYQRATQLALRAPAFAAQQCRPFGGRIRRQRTWPTGKLPQAFSHLAVVNSAHNLSTVSKRARPTTVATLNGNPCRSDVLSLRRHYFEESCRSSLGNLGRVLSGACSGCSPCHVSNTCPRPGRQPRRAAGRHQSL
jgi:hypothetical protein